MNTKDYVYSWHLSLRVDRPVEGCPMRPHAYMYGKKVDNGASNNMGPIHPNPPPAHEFRYRWFRGPPIETCAYEGCPRRTSFSPHEWSKHALGGTDCAIQCVSTQSSLYKCVFCNTKCFVKAWKSQYTIQTNATPTRTRSTSYSDNEYEDARSNGSKSPFENQDSEYWEISRENIWIPSHEDVGRKLKLEASAYSLTGEFLMTRVLQTDVVLSRPPDPIPRQWVSANLHTGGAPRFRVASYNVLAEIYATQQQYPYCDFWALNWDYRFQNILREIIDAAPDVLCLQEIQADFYESQVYQALSDAGYDGVYKQKTRQSMGLAGKVDGCGLFWRRSKFHLVESYSIEFNEVAQRQAQQIGLNLRSDEGISFVNRLSKDNIAQLVVLEFVNGARSTQLCIANTHLYSNKDFPDVKLWQSWQLLQELESFFINRSTHLPLIICGDFNSTPDTAVYELLSRGQVHPGHPDVNVAANNEEVPNVLPDAMNITSAFQLGSAYNTVMGEEPWTTNYTVNFKGTLDYIWYSGNHLRPLAVAPVPDEKQLTTKGEALPSTEYSSDHVMLISDMQIIAR